MEDFFDNFDDGEFMDDDSMEDSFDDDFGSEDSLDHSPEIEDESTDDVCDDEFTMKGAVILGSAMGWAYEEGLEEAERRKLEKKMNKEGKDNEQDNF